MMRGAKNQYEKRSEEKGSDSISHAPSQPHHHLIRTLGKPGRVQVAETDCCANGRSEHASGQDKLENALRCVKSLNSLRELVDYICGRERLECVSNLNRQRRVQG